MTLPQWTSGPGYTPISLKVIQDEFGCTIFAPPPPAEIYPTVTSLTPSSTIIIDEDAYRFLTYTVNFTNRNQRRIYWSAYLTTANGSASLSDFDALPSGEINLDTANFTIIIAPDTIVEGNETYAIQFKTDPNGPSFYTSSPYTIIDIIPPTPSPSPGSTPMPTPSPSPTTLTKVTYSLGISGPLEVSFNKGANVTITGAPNDTVVFKYVKPNIENLYFDYYPDVEQSYGINNLGLTKEEYAERHYQTYGRNELRISPSKLLLESEPTNGAVSLNSFGTRVFDIFNNKPLLGRTTPYTFQLYGSKTSNVVTFSVKVKIFYRLGVYGPNQIQSGERAYLQVFGYPTDTITYIGNSNGTFFLNSQGFGNFDITGGVTLTSGNYNWSFSGNSTPNSVFYSLKVSTYTLLVTGSPILNIGDIEKVSIIVTITGAPNEVVSYSGFLIGSFILDSNGRLTTDISQDVSLISGTYSVNFTGSRSSNTATYTFEIRRYGESVLPGPSPYRHRVGIPFTLSLAGGVPESVAFISFTGPNGSSGFESYQLNQNGVYSIENQQFNVPGIYTYKINFNGSGNQRVHVIEVLSTQLRVNQRNYTVSGTNSYDSTQPIIVEIEGAPNEIVAISQPTWPTLIPVYGENEIYRNFLRSNGYLRGFAETRYVEGSNISTWANYPIDNGFPARYIFLDASGKCQVNLNGDEAINIDAQASDFSWTRNPTETFISVLGKKIDYTFSRGHTMAILSNVNLYVESISTYDTFDGGGIVGSTEVEFKRFEDALFLVPDGKIIVITSFEAIRISANMRSILNSSYGGVLTDEWTSKRLALAEASHVFIGIKNGGVPAVEEIKRLGPAQSKFFVEGINSNQNGYPHLMKYNYDAYRGTGTKFFYNSNNDNWDLVTIDLNDSSIVQLNSQRQMYQQVPYSFSVIGNKSLISTDFVINVQTLNFANLSVIVDSDSSSIDTNIEDVFQITPSTPTYRFDKLSYITFEGSKLEITMFTKNIPDNTTLWYRLEPVVGILQKGYNNSTVFVVNKNVGRFFIEYGTREGRNGNIQARLIISTTKEGPAEVQGPLINIFDPVGPNTGLV